MNRSYTLSMALLVATGAALPSSKLAAQPHSTPCSSTVFARLGAYSRTARLHGPGLVLAGGGAEEAPVAIFGWMRRTLAGRQTGRAGNVVVLRASSADEYDPLFYREGRFQSVQTVLIPPCAPASDLARAAAIVDGADAVFFAGGDQAHYVAWKGSPLIDAVKRVYARGGIVGGGSAGLAIQGAVVFDSVAGDRLNAGVHSADALADPLEPRISFTTGLFAWPALRDTLTDTHFAIRNRFGRTVVFLARIARSGLLPKNRSPYALGIDQASAVVVDADGRATLFNGPSGKGAYIVRAPAHSNVSANRPFVATVYVSHVRRTGETFDLLHKTTSDPWYAVTVRAGLRPYSRNPYDL